MQRLPGVRSLPCKQKKKKKKKGKLGRETRNSSWLALLRYLFEILTVAAARDGSKDCCDDETTNTIHGENMVEKSLTDAPPRKVYGGG